MILRSCAVDCALDIVHSCEYCIKMSICAVKTKIIAVSLTDFQNLQLLAFGIAVFFLRVNLEFLSNAKT